MSIDGCCLYRYLLMFFKWYKNGGIDDCCLYGYLLMCIDDCCLRVMSVDDYLCVFFKCFLNGIKNEDM